MKQPLEDRIVALTGMNISAVLDALEWQRKAVNSKIKSVNAQIADHERHIRDLENQLGELHEQLRSIDQSEGWLT